MDMALDTLYAEMNKDGNDKHNTSDVPLRQSINADVDWNEQEYIDVWFVWRGCHIFLGLDVLASWK